VIVGAAISRTVTTKAHVALFPLSSLAVQVTVVVPTGKVPPEGGAQTTAGVASHTSPTTGVG
jgi:hypothetical protein